MNRLLCRRMGVALLCLAAGCAGANARWPAGGPDSGLGAQDGAGLSAQDGARLSAEAGSVPSRPLLFAAMIHLEGDLQIPDAQAYALLNKRLQELLDLFSRYEAKLTVEAERPYAEAARKWGNDQLTYALARGHGVGTHCDFAMTISDTSALTSQYQANKAAVDALVGAEHNLGCSGGWSAADWVGAARAAGFKYLDAPVMLAYLSAPQADRPDQLSDEEIISTYYHDPVPVELAQRIYPRLLADARDLEADPDGELLLISGSLGEISSLHEGRKSCFPRCEFTAEDLDAIIRQIDQVNSFRDPDKLALLYLHVPLGTLDQPPARRAENTALLETWLQTMQRYGQQERLRWQTMEHVYAAYSSAR